MRLLVITQVMDERHPVLGFFVRWVEELAARVDAVEVICLFEGEHNVPVNVRVHSLGKELGARPSLVYAARFILLAWKLRGRYDRVFVHMNEEYLLLAGWLWNLLKKPAYLWRNHYAGSWRTDLAAVFARGVFCTSESSYTARFQKSFRMPVGVDLDRFRNKNSAPANSILFLARISPSKRVEVFLEALELVALQGKGFSASIYGSALPEDEEYHQQLRERVHKGVLKEYVSFYSAVSHQEAARVFAEHALFVNCSRSGMFDKTIFEAAASGCLAVAASEDWARYVEDEVLAFPSGSAQELAVNLEKLLSMEASRRDALLYFCRKAAEEHSLQTLMDRLTQALAR